MTRPALAIVGPTASGKSALGLELARRVPGNNIVSADAMQVYRGMDIGTAKPAPAERAEVPHHLVDVADPWEDYSLARYLEHVGAVVDADRSILVGGTGLYVRAVVDHLEVPGQWPDVRAGIEEQHDTVALHRRLTELDPLAASRMEPTNRRRIVRALEVTLGAGRPFSSFGPGLGAYPPIATRQFGLDVPLDVLDGRITARVHRMMDAGFLAEVERLAADPRGLSRTARQALGYRELLGHLEGGVPLPVAVGDIVTRTRRFARRQLRWFRRDPRIVWVDGRLSPADLADLTTR